MSELDNSTKRLRRGLGPHRTAERACNAHERVMRDRTLYGRREVGPASWRKGVLDLPCQIGFGAKRDAHHGKGGEAAKEIHCGAVHGRDHMLNQQAIRAEAQIHKLRIGAIGIGGTSLIGIHV